MKNIQVGKKVKLSLFAVDMSLSTENPKVSIKETIIISTARFQDTGSTYKNQLYVCALAKNTLKIKGNNASYNRIRE